MTRGDAAQPDGLPRGEYQLDTAFDVPGVSELAHRERSAFKPVYSMNRWWARRSSAVFRAILLGLLDPGKDPSSDRLYLNARQAFPEATDQVILDPFMGGGTSIVEGLRVGFRAAGVDLNPLSWFIVRNETTAVDIDELDAAYQRVAASVAAKVAALYATTCPCCSQPAEAIHSFWAKQAGCTTCGETVELRRDRIVGRRRGHATIRFTEVACPACTHPFDAELDRASLTYGTDPSTGEDDESAWSTIDDGRASCPNCATSVAVDGGPVQVKKVEVFALQCPACDTCTTERGPVPAKALCPACETRYVVAEGNNARGMFECSDRHMSSISQAAQAHKGPLTFRLYAIEGYCASCAASGDAMPAAVGNRFYKAPDADDLLLLEKTNRAWARQRSKLPHPTATIADYEKTNRLTVHNYRKWSELFNPRQLLALGWMLQAIRAEPDQMLREALTAAFLGTIEHQNMLNIYYLPYAQSAGAFGRHDFHPKVNACEGNPWGGSKGRGTFKLSYKTVREGKQYLLHPFEPDYRTGTRRRTPTGEAVTARQVGSFDDLTANGSGVWLRTGDSRHLASIPDQSIDHVVTDPPYADAVQYAELADFFYVWLTEALGDVHPEVFAGSETPKAAELVENVSRGHSQDDFHAGLTQVFAECHRVMKHEGRLVFTFHHSRRSQWADLHRVIAEAGFDLIASYPVASEGTRSGNLVFHTNKGSVAYDIIHVCAKTDHRAHEPIRWTDGKKEVVRRVRREVKNLLTDVDHGQRVGTADVAVMVWAEVLRIYSEHRDQVLVGRGDVLPIADALDGSDELVEKIGAYAAGLARSPSSPSTTS